jgi:serine kinase of HPr protein (carbohydrate metabolism regulator)
MLSQQGRQVFHGSAVALKFGAVVFVGDSGRVKSTLAASFANHGIGFLTDDALLLQEDNGSYLVEPSHPSVRLREDSAKSVARIGAQYTPAVTYTKKQVLLAVNGLD